LRAKLKEINGMVRIFKGELINSGHKWKETCKPLNSKFSKIVVLGLFFSLVIIPLAQETFGQTKRKVIQLTGIILGEDSVSGVPGVHIFVPKAGRGTTSNGLGYFSMPTLVGDSVVFSSVGYERQYYIVPDRGDKDQLTLIIELEHDITYLEPIDILPFPTEELFKEAVLALNIPIDEGQLKNQHMSAEILAFMLANTPMDASMNYRNYMANQQFYQMDRYGPRPNPMLNPFNWANFYRSLKRGDYKGN
jgi:hypothetical protein